jgi:hypothetical protein
MVGLKQVLRKFIINFSWKKGQVYIEEHRAGADALDEGKILWLN